MRLAAFFYVIFGTLPTAMLVLAVPGYATLGVFPLATFALGLWLLKRTASRVLLAAGFFTYAALGLALRNWFFLPEANTFTEDGRVIAIMAVLLTFAVAMIVFALEREQASAMGKKPTQDGTW